MGQNLAANVLIASAKIAWGGGMPQTMFVFSNNGFAVIYGEDGETKDVFLTLDGYNFDETMSVQLSPYNGNSPAGNLPKSLVSYGVSIPRPAPMGNGVQNTIRVTGFFINEDGEVSEEPPEFEIQVFRATPDLPPSGP